MKTLTVQIDNEYWEREFPEERGLKMTGAPTQRGFSRWEFDDLYQQKCSLQNSSLATEGAIWLGVDNTGPSLEGPNGKKNEQVGARMHLSRKQVEQLLPLLHNFVEKGSIDQETQHGT